MSAPTTADVLAGLATTREADQRTREHRALHAHPTLCIRPACDDHAALVIGGLEVCGGHSKELLGWWAS